MYKVTEIANKTLRDITMLRELIMAKQDMNYADIEYCIHCLDQARDSIENVKYTYELNKQHAERIAE